MWPSSIAVSWWLRVRWKNFALAWKRRPAMRQTRRRPAGSRWRKSFFTPSAAPARLSRSCHGWDERDRRLVGAVERHRRSPLAHVHAFSAHPQGGAGAVLAGHRQPRHCQRRARWRHPARGRCVVFHLPAETGVADSVAVAGIFVLADVPAHGHRLDRDYRFLAFAALSSELSRLRDGAPDLRRPRSGNGAGRSMARGITLGVGWARPALLPCTALAL